MSEISYTVSRRRFLGSTAACSMALLAGERANCLSATPDSVNSASVRSIDVEAAMEYICNEMDQFHRRCVVYDDPESGGARFAPEKWMYGRSDQSLPLTDDVLKDIQLDYRKPDGRSGTRVMRIQFRPRGVDDWLAIAWVAAGSPGSAIDLSGATRVRWSARSLEGTQRVTFQFGIFHDPSLAVRDSHPEQAVTYDLTGQWANYELPLSKGSLARVVSGFCVLLRGAAARQFDFELANIEIDHSRLNEPRLVRSYRLGFGIEGPHPALRNACYLYDNAVAISALLSTAKQTNSNVDRAVLIAEAMVQLARADTINGTAALRLRNGYCCGDLFLPGDGKTRWPRFPGWMNPSGDDAARKVPWSLDSYSQGTDSGNMAWAGLALLNVWNVTRNRDFLQTAKSLAQWVFENCNNTPLGFGFSGGVQLDDRQQEQSCVWSSTEHNIDLTALFRRLAQLETDPARARTWADSAKSADRFVQWAFVKGASDGARLITGTKDATADPAMDPKPLDTQSWSVLALPDQAERLASGLDWVERSCRLHLSNLWGYGFSSISKDIWPEGTAQMSLAWRSRGRDDQADAIMGQLSQLQSSYRLNHPDSRGSLPAAATEKVLTGYKNIVYWHVPHLGATAWSVLAARRYNPFYAEKLK